MIKSCCLCSLPLLLLAAHVSYLLHFAFVFVFALAVNNCLMRSVSFFLSFLFFVLTNCLSCLVPRSRSVYLEVRFVYYHTTYHNRKQRIQLLIEFLADSLFAPTIDRKCDRSVNTRLSCCVFRLCVCSCSCTPIPFDFHCLERGVAGSVALAVCCVLHRKFVIQLPLFSK